MSIRGAAGNLPALPIGTFCIEHSHSLLHEDRDFAPMEQHLGLMAA
jgi:predicted nucleic acid-binding protein